MAPRLGLFRRKPKEHVAVLEPITEHPHDPDNELGNEYEYDHEPEPEPPAPTRMSSERAPRTVMVARRPKPPKPPKPQREGGVGGWRSLFGRTKAPRDTAVGDQRREQDMNLAYADGPSERELRSGLGRASAYGGPEYDRMNIGVVPNESPPISRHSRTASTLRSNRPRGMVIQHPTILEEGQGSPSQSQHSMLGQHVPGVQHYTMTPHQTLEVNGHLIEMTNEAAGGLGSPTQSIRSDHEMFVDGNMEPVREYPVPVDRDVIFVVDEGVELEIGNPETGEFQPYDPNTYQAPHARKPSEDQIYVIPPGKDVIFEDDQGRVLFRSGQGGKGFFDVTQARDGSQGGYQPDGSYVIYSSLYRSRPPSRAASVVGAPSVVRAPSEGRAEVRPPSIGRVPSDGSPSIGRGTPPERTTPNGSPPIGTLPPPIGVRELPKQSPPKVFIHWEPQPPPPPPPPPPPVQHAPPSQPLLDFGTPPDNQRPIDIPAAEQSIVREARNVPPPEPKRAKARTKPEDRPPVRERRYSPSPPPKTRSTRARAEDRPRSPPTTRERRYSPSPPPKPRKALPKAEDRPRSPPRNRERRYSPSPPPVPRKSPPQAEDRPRSPSIIREARYSPPAEPKRDGSSRARFDDPVREQRFSPSPRRNDSPREKFDDRAPRREPRYSPPPPEPTNLLSVEPKSFEERVPSPRPLPERAPSISREPRNSPPLALDWSAFSSPPLGEPEPRNRTPSFKAPSVREPTPRVPSIRAASPRASSIAEGKRSPAPEAESTPLIPLDEPANPGTSTTPQDDWGSGWGETKDKGPRLLEIPSQPTPDDVEGTGNMDSELNPIDTPAETTETAETEGFTQTGKAKRGAGKANKKKRGG